MAVYVWRKGNEYVQIGNECCILLSINELLLLTLFSQPVPRDHSLPGLRSQHSDPLPTINLQWRLHLHSWHSHRRHLPGDHRCLPVNPPQYPTRNRRRSQGYLHSHLFSSLSISWSQHLSLKVCWMVLFTFFSILTGIGFYNVVYDFAQYPVTTSVTVKHQNQVNPHSVFSKDAGIENSSFENNPGPL